MFRPLQIKPTIPCTYGQTILFLFVFHWYDAPFNQWNKKREQYFAPSVSFFPRARSMEYYLQVLEQPLCILITDWELYSLLATNLRQRNL